MTVLVTFIGSKQLGLQALKQIFSQRACVLNVITIDDHDDSRSELVGFRDFCSSNNLALNIVSSPKEVDALLQSTGPDWCFVVGWFWLLSKEALGSVRNGCLGIHNSILPKFRGSAPLVWAMMAGEKEVGISLFSLTAEMDDGPVWHVERMPICHNDSIASVLAGIEKLIERMIDSCFKDILSGKLKPVPQNHDLATYCAQRVPKDGKVNWNMPAARVYDFIRAQSHPYPGAFTDFSGKQLVIQSARMFSPRYWGTPGQVARITQEGVYVVCGDNQAIIIETVLYDGSLVLSSSIIQSVGVRFQ